MKLRKFFTGLAILMSTLLTAQSTYYCAPSDATPAGNDTNTGTINDPWETWQKAFDMAEAGDTVYFRGGVWYPTETTFQSSVLLLDPLANYDSNNPRGNSGTSDNPIHFLNYPNEKPILDCRNVTPNGNYLDGISLYNIHYTTFRGLEIRNIYQTNFGVTVNGIATNLCSNLTFENMSVHDIGGRGMWLTSVLGYLNDTDPISDTSRVINCDFYNCADTLETHPFNMGDGIKGDLESNGVFIMKGVRVWNCSDDGLDLSGAGQKLIDSCWVFNMASSYTHIYTPDDGNGFKLGGVRDSIDYPNFIMSNCIAAGCPLGSGLGELDYDPYYRNNARVYNSIFYQCSAGIWSFTNRPKPFYDTEYYNCIVYDNIEQEFGAFLWDYSANIFTCNWDYSEYSEHPYTIPNSVCTITDDDFVSLDINELASPRKTDGSLPDVDFFKPVANSDLIDGGTDVGKQFVGNAPEVGVWEYNDSHPLATFTYLDDHIVVGESVSFNASNSTDDGTIVSYSWDFGDGDTYTGANTSVSHAFSTFGIYRVKLTIIDNSGNTGTISKDITVIGSNPIAKFYAVSALTTINYPVPFNADQSVDDIGIVSYTWDFGDGNINTGVSPIHQYSTPGDYTVVLTVADGDGNSDTVTEDVKILSYGPVANFTYSPANPVVGQTVTVDASSSTDDYGVTSYIWSFGDNIDGSGETDTHVYTNPGQYNIILSVYDEDGLYNTTYGPITVNSVSTSSVTTISELNAALSTANSGDVIELSANIFTGSITISTNLVTITAASGYTPILEDVTITGSSVSLTNLSFTGTLHLNACLYPSVTNCTFTGSGTIISITKSNLDYYLWTFEIDNNTYNISSTSIIGGYNRGDWRSNYLHFDRNSTFNVNQ